MSRKENAAKMPGPVNDYSGTPPEVRISDRGVGKTYGTTTGEEEHRIVPGGWQGTDDATSTAPSDLAIPPAPPNHSQGNEGVADLSGKPVEESRAWDKDAV